MIDAERMLGSLVRNALSEGAGLGRKRGRKRKRRGRGSILGSAGKGALAMGALGVAFGAWEHFSQKQAQSFPAGAGPGQPPPPPPANPPPLPPLPTAAAEPTPEAAGGDDEALLLVRAMIAAANADHELDADERARILQALDEADAGEKDRAFLLAELESPLGLGALADQATTPALATQVYLASCLAIEIDSRAERNYLDRLADRLGLTPEQAAELEGQIEETEETATADSPGEGEN